MIDRLVELQNGAALIIDYGDASGSGDTLQAVRGHEYVDVLENPGEADLTVHVNFGDIARAAQNCACHLTTQGQFLKNLGIVERTATLSAGKSKEKQQSFGEASRRLTAKDEMGTLFKAMAITQTDAPTPLGF
jgi:SAM-dependent MidA family methyltransferase